MVKIEVIKHAIKQAMEDVGPSGSSHDDIKHDHHQLSKLMSQLEKLESEPEDLPSPNGDLTDTNNNDISNLKDDEEEDDKIVKELKKLNRQNFITNCLLSAILVLTVTWQISQVSIILSLKNGVTQPFRSVGSLFKSIIKRHKPNGNNEDMDSLTTGDLIESLPVHNHKLPEFQHIELPKINFGFI